MTVAELIEELKKYPPNMPVLIEQNQYYPKVTSNITGVMRFDDLKNESLSYIGVFLSK